MAAEMRRLTLSVACVGGKINLTGQRCIFTSEAAVDGRLGWGRNLHGLGLRTLLLGVLVQLDKTWTPIRLWYPWKRDVRMFL